MTASSSYVPSQGKSFNLRMIFVCFAIILLGIIVRWLTTNTSTTTGVIATTVTVAAYVQPPTTTEFVDKIDDLSAPFTKKSGLSIKKHRCTSRASWGLLSRNKEILHWEWDSQHGDIEVYSNGVHTGSINFKNPEVIKPPVLGRMQSCTCN